MVQMPTHTINLNDLAGSFHADSIYSGDFVSRWLFSLQNSIASTNNGIDAILLEAFGRHGSGIIVIEGIPEPILCARHRLLSAMRTVAALPDEAKAALLKQGRLGTDVPIKSGASGKKAAQPTHPFTATCTVPLADPSPTTPAAPCACTTAHAGDHSSPACGACLQSDITLLGTFLARVCLLVAHACDRALGGSAAGPAQGSLLQALLAGGTGKARAIHYHAAPEQGDSTCAESVPATASACRPLSAGYPSHSPWQPWHYDYGLFTGLLGPSPGDEGARCGLHVLQRDREQGGGTPGWHACPAPIPAHAVAVQVGEAAQILSGGRLAATAHCVLRPPLPSLSPAPQPLSRQQLVVFCQPAWCTRMVPLGWDGGSDSAGCSAGGGVLEATSEACQLLASVLPPLSTRWSASPPPTFSAFSRATTGAYFGARAVQATSAGAGGGPGARGHLLTASSSA